MGMPRPAILRTCGALVGAAVAVFLWWILLQALPISDLGAWILTVLALAILLGGAAGLVAAQTMIDRPKAHTPHFAALVFALACLAVPFLLYSVAAAVVIAAISSYQF